MSTTVSETAPTSESAKTSSSDDLLVSMEGITKRFGGLVALDNVDFQVRSNEVVGLVGDNGAGKSTLIEILAGALHLTEGQICYKGQLVDITTPEKAKQLGIETVYQDLALAGNLNVTENLFLGREQYRFKLGPIGVLAKNQMKQQAQDVLDVLNIQFGSLDATVRNLSGGQRQAIAVARAVYKNPDLVILDEPTAALAVEESERVQGLINDLNEQDISVVFISHTLQEVFSTADRIVILNQGEKVGNMTPDETDMDEVVKLMIGQRGTDS